MAVVRMSNELQREIIARANGLYAKRLDASTASFTLPFTGVQLYDELFRPWRTHMDALPPEFFFEAGSMSIRRVGHIYVPENDLPLGVSYKFPRGLPKGYDFDLSTSFSTGRGGYAFVVLLMEPGGNGRWDKLIADAVAWKMDHDKVISERDKFVTSVREVICAHTTLNAALKTWPALWELVPDEAKNRVRRSTERSKADAKVVDVDINKLTATVAASKIL